MPPDHDITAQAAGNNSSDFVRKLYKMLEDPSYNSVVRWSNDGESFVVLENEKFTKTILPKHFKHSNFASFVRQLNKYDFHKVRHTEENGEAPYGRDAWEFHHPEFKADRKDQLDNIRRKAPALRKQAQTEEVFPTNQQLAVMSESLVASQHQIQALQEQQSTLMQTNRVLVSEIMNLRKQVTANTQVSNELTNHLSNMDDRRRSSRHLQSNHSNGAAAFQTSSLGLLPDSTDEPAAELRRARDILNAVIPDSQADRDLERLSLAFQESSPPDSTASSVMYSQPGSAPMSFAPGPTSDPRHLVYPVGQTMGIDPFHSDHIHNIPYSRPISNTNTLVDVPAQATPPLCKERGEPLWAGKTGPRIMLVEDDKTCSRIGAKFLSSAGCLVEVASDGLDAVNKVNQKTNYDLIFMDIIMPQLDGLSATSLIRMVAPRTPIIAMTSNIRQEDINMYFQFSMNDVLAKPFTRDGMVRILTKHLSFLLRDPGSKGMADDMGHNNTAVGASSDGTSQGFGMGQYGTSSIGAGAQVKIEQTPIQSPATTASWHSPNQISTTHGMEASSYMTAVGSGSGGGVMTTGSTHRPPYSGQGIPQVATGFGHVSGDLSAERPEKRQRMYAPAQNAYAH